VKAYRQARQHGAAVAKGTSTSYLFETVTDECPLTDSMSVDDLIETFRHRAARSVFVLFYVRI